MQRSLRYLAAFCLLFSVLIGAPFVASAATGHKVGDTAPDFTALDQYGRQVSLSDFQNKNVIIDFSTVWCHPCRRLMTYSEEVVKTLRANGVEVVWITMLLEDQFGQPSQLVDAYGWADTFQLASPVLHMGGMGTVQSPIKNEYNDYASGSENSGDVEAGYPLLVFLDSNHVIKKLSLGQMPPAHILAIYKTGLRAPRVPTTPIDNVWGLRAATLTVSAGSGIGVNPHAVIVEKNSGGIPVGNLVGRGLPKNFKGYISAGPDTPTLGMTNLNVTFGFAEGTAPDGGIPHDLPLSFRISRASYTPRQPGRLIYADATIASKNLFGETITTKNLNYSRAVGDISIGTFTLKSLGVPDDQVVGSVVGVVPLERKAFGLDIANLIAVVQEYQQVNSTDKTAWLDSLQQALAALAPDYNGSTTAGTYLDNFINAVNAYTGPGLNFENLDWLNETATELKAMVPQPTP